MTPILLPGAHHPQNSSLTWPHTKSLSLVKIPMFKSRLFRSFSLLSCLFFAGLPGIAGLVNGQVAQSPAPVPTTTTSPVPAVSAAATAQRRPPHPQQISARAPWIVNVAHVINLSEVADIYRKNQGIEVSPADAIPTSEVQLLNISTGIVIDSKGHVLVQLAHLNPNESSNNLTICTTNDETLSAKFVGLDGVTGLAVLKIEGLEIEPPAFLNDGPSQKSIQLDQQVFVWLPTFGKTAPRMKARLRALAPPRGRITPARVVEVSATQVEIRPEKPLAMRENVAGGIVLNEANQVVGLVQAEDGDTFQVVPVAMVTQAFRRVLKSGRSVPRGWLGIGGKDIALLPEADRAQLKLSTEKGILVDTVLPNSPADKAGIKLWDVIEAVDGRPLGSLKDFLAFVGQRPAGSQFQLSLMRDNKALEKLVVLGDREYAGTITAQKDPLLEAMKVQIDELQKVAIEMRAQTNANQSAEAAAQTRVELSRVEASLDTAIKRYESRAQQNNLVVRNETTVLGIVTTDLTRQLAAFFGVAQTGVLVNSIDARGFLSQIGIQAGDIIIELNGQPVISHNQLNWMLNNQPLVLESISIVRKKQTLKFALNRLHQPSR
ncbi:MAG TPA: PDZ domain-containing protein [Acidobacteriota bacterium]|nr:PDZ domain-containing protein [Acidobacteriota bacterium]HNB69917.1 PDZ domain-containing protein [Acidobacteriota bacterium]HND18027.1 PDZ domain-containing protein [Acidobacteriota bacterium]